MSGSGATGVWNASVGASDSTPCRSRCSRRDRVGATRKAPQDSTRSAHTVIILGVLLLIIGFAAKIAILWTIGVILLVVGAILFVLGSVGHAVAGRRHYW